MSAARRRSVVIAATAATGALAAGVIAVPAIGAADIAANPTEFQLFEHDTSDQTDKVGDPRTGVGNLFIFGGNVLDHQGGSLVGRMGGSCSNTSTTEILCTAAFTIDGGQIDFQGIADTGPFFSGQPTDFAITGGTGPYRDAHGTITGQIQPDGVDAVFTVRLD